MLRLFPFRARVWTLLKLSGLDHQVPSLLLRSCLRCLVSRSLSSASAEAAATVEAKGTAAEGAAVQSTDMQEDRNASAEDSNPVKMETEETGQ